MVLIRVLLLISTLSAPISAAKSKFGFEVPESS